MSKCKNYVECLCLQEEGNGEKLWDLSINLQKSDFKNQGVFTQGLVVLFQAWAWLLPLTSTLLACFHDGKLFCARAPLANVKVLIQQVAVFTSLSKEDKGSTTVASTHVCFLGTCSVNPLPTATSTMQLDGCKKPMLHGYLRYVKRHKKMLSNAFMLHLLTNFLHLSTHIIQKYTWIAPTCPRTEFVFNHIKLTILWCKLSSDLCCVNSLSETETSSLSSQG